MISVRAHSTPTPSPLTAGPVVRRASGNASTPASGPPSGERAALRPRLCTPTPERVLRSAAPSPMVAKRCSGVVLIGDQPFLALLDVLSPVPVLPGTTVFCPGPQRFPLTLSKRERYIAFSLRHTCVPASQGCVWIARARDLGWICWRRVSLGHFA